MTQTFTATRVVFAFRGRSVSWSCLAGLCRFGRIWGRLRAHSLLLLAARILPDVFVNVAGLLQYAPQTPREWADLPNHMKQL